jgi:hypothetical protein
MEMEEERKLWPPLHSRCLWPWPSVTQCERETRCECSSAPSVPSCPSVQCPASREWLQLGAGVETEFAASSAQLCPC